MSILRFLFGKVAELSWYGEELEYREKEEDCEDHDSDRATFHQLILGKGKALETSSSRGPLISLSGLLALPVGVDRDGLETELACVVADILVPQRTELVMGCLITEPGVDVVLELELA